MKLVWLGISLGITVALVPARLCPPGQERFIGSCYQLLTGRMDWEYGNRTCYDLGARLAVPDTPAEHHFIWTMFTEAVGAGNLWIGCNDRRRAGRWVLPGGGSQACNYLN